MNQPSKIPLAAKLFATFSCGLFITIMFILVHRKLKHNEETATAIRNKLAARQRAEDLAQEGYRQLVQERRNQLFARCRTDGNYPLLFIDKVVCVKPEAIAWVSYDTIPEVGATEEN